MRIPSDPLQRDSFYQDVIRHCAVSRPERAANYRRWERWYELGTEGGTRARYNMLAAYVDRATAYVYSQDTTRFACKLPRHLQEQWAPHAELARDVFSDLWHGSDSDLQVGQAIEYAYPFGATILKTVTWPSLALYYLDPADFGVITEHCPRLSDQEAVVHWFTATNYEMDRYLSGGPGRPPHPRKDIIMASLEGTVTPGTAEDGNGIPAAMGTVIVSALNPLVSVTGNAMVGPNSGIPEPQVDIPLTELAELWIWDDARDDYRCVTYLESAGLTIWERLNPTLPDELPFTKVCPFPHKKYFWGRVDIEKQMPLQEWRELLMTRIDDLLKRQLKPPKALIGFPGITDEKAQALNRSGGILTSNSPGGRVENLRPEMPPDAFAEVHQIDFMSGETGGLPAVLQGQGDAGVRAGQQANVMATLASARPRKRAFIVEDQIEEAATKLFRVQRRMDETVYALPDGREFLLAHLPPETSMQISAHTASPLYQEATERKADKLLKAGAIDKPTYVELIDPPMSDAIRARARVLEKAQAQAREQMLRARHEEQMAKATKKK